MVCLCPVCGKGIQIMREMTNDKCITCLIATTTHDIQLGHLQLLLDCVNGNGKVFCYFATEVAALANQLMGLNWNSQCEYCFDDVPHEEQHAALTLCQMKLCERNVLHQF